MKIEIDVVLVKKKLLFRYKKYLFREIEGMPRLEGGSLTILRNGQIFDKTDHIGSCGAQDEGTAFRGLNNLAKETYLLNGTGSCAFIPQNFKLGDKVVLEPLDEIEKDYLLKWILKKDAPMIEKIWLKDIEEFKKNNPA